MTEPTDRPVDLAGEEIDSDDLSSNPSTAPCLRDVVTARLSRRSVLQGGMLTAAAFLTTRLGDAPAAHAAQARQPGAARGGQLLGFTPIALSTADDVLVPPGYSAVPFIPWGTPLQPSGPRFVPGSPTWSAPATRPPSSSSRSACTTTACTTSRSAAEATPAAAGCSRSTTSTPTRTCCTPRARGRPSRQEYTLDMVRKSQAANGVSVLEAREDQRGRWKVMPSRYSRRITANTPMTFSGPAASSPLLDTGAPADGTHPVGTVNNCGHGVTPWGTYLTCEENFNGYFDVERREGMTATQQQLLSRYGISNDGRYNWTTHDERFRVTPESPNEPNRFGWVVEIDPFAPDAAPVKRTALGRVQHEGAFVHASPTGHAVVYMGDDQANDYAYKFVSARPWRQMLLEGKSPLDDGTLYVAQFADDGSGRWLPLVHGQNGLTAGDGFADQGDVLVKTRLAADAVGATPMDRPEWTTVDPTTGMVYLTLTNNTGRRTPNGPMPRALADVDDADRDDDTTELIGNPWGQALRWEEAGNDHTATTFTWDLLLLAGKGDGTDGSTIDPEDAFGSPDGLWADRDGRVWIQTDGRQPQGAHNQMLAADPTPLIAGGVAAAPDVRRFLTGPCGCEVTGDHDARPADDVRQHPAPERHLAARRGRHPRSSTVVVVKDDGGVIGT